jgi:DNA-directed RNA polymerase specialized sigma24 family protein
MQEALLAVWQGLAYYDSSRASLRTFSERAIANKLTSIVRCHCAGRRAWGPPEALAAEPPIAVPADLTWLRVDVSKILAGATAFDRAVAAHLTEYSPAETGRRLKVPRAAIYRAIGRLRIAFIAAGLHPAKETAIAPQ